MTTEFALIYIPQKMQELGIGENYLLQFRHFVLKPKETREIEAYNQYYLLIEPPQEISITSDMGVYDQYDESANEMRYEHQGAIQMQNLSSETIHVKFIQVIPKHNRPCR